MRTIVLAAFVAMIVACAAGGAAAQTIGGVVGVSHQDPGESDLPAFGRGFGGTAFAALAGIDRGLKGHFAIGAELSTAAAISGDQSRRTSTTTSAFVSHHRDTVISGTAKFLVPIGSRLRVAAAGGAGGAYRRTTREGTISSIFPPASRQPLSETDSSFVPAFTAGAELGFRIAARLSILAAYRHHWLHDDDRTDDGTVRRGVSSAIDRGGIGAQWRF